MVARLVQSGHATRGPGSLGRAVECTESSHSESCWQPPAASWRGNGELFICSPKNEQEVFIGSRTTSKFGSNQLKLCSIYNLFFKEFKFCRSSLLELRLDIQQNPLFNFLSSSSRAIHMHGKINMNFSSGGHTPLYGA